MKLKTFLLSVFFIIFSFTCISAGTKGKIKGKVLDSSKQPLIGCNVFIKDTSMGQATDANGEYYIINVPPGEYTLVASYLGYKRQEVEKVKVSADYTTTVNFEMQEETVQGETIVIVAERPIIQKDATATVAFVDAKEFEELPFESFQAAVKTKAGVTTDAGGGMHIRGGRSNEILYIIDGIPANNPFTYSTSSDVATNAIQELSVISGSFNAEYGKAQSGVINIVTKEGSPSYSGSILFQTGDVFTRHDDIFLNTDDTDLLNTKEIEASFGGPVPGTNRKLSFFLSTRFYDDGGYLYGQRRYGVPDKIGGLLYPTSGDSSFASMNPYKKLNVQGKLACKLSPNIKLTYSGILTDRESQSYTHTKKYSPDGTLKYFFKSQQHNISLTHQLNPQTYYNLIVSYLRDKNYYYVYEDMRDERYYSWSYWVQADQWQGFLMGGTQNDRETRLAETYVIKSDITSQLNNWNMVKAGFEYRKMEMHYYYINPDRDFETGEFEIPEEGRTLNRYHKKPYEFSGYIQDKMELTEMVINFGLRFDYFNPKDVIPVDFDQLTSSEYRNVKAKYQLSPRFSLAHPVTDRSKIFFSYGHFFQLPPYENLYLLNESYENPNAEIRTGILSTIIGNTDLKPQKTISYEVGYEIALTDDIGFFIKGYYRDMRDLLDTELHQLPNGTIYAAYTNLDYGNVKGLNVTLTKRMSNYFSGSIDYTYQVAEGNSSSPIQVYTDARNSAENEKKVVPLSWDQPHALRINFNLITPGGFGLGVIATAESGYPYTPAIQTEYAGLIEKNSGRKPSRYNLDMNLYKDFNINFGGRKIKYRIYIKCYNLLDRLNENYVYDSTGRAGYTLDKTLTADYVNRPNYYSKPRTIYFGSSINF